MRRVARPPADVALAATLHDARGALRADVERFLPRLQAMYRGIAVTTTPGTAPRIVARLAAAGVHAGTAPSNLRGPLYRLALRRAHALGAPAVHYVDFDRALHWMRRAPRELRAILRLARRHPLVVVGRTDKAHRSHHVPLYATEALANRLVAARLGIAGRMDFLAPSFLLTRELVATLLARSRARDEGLYGEWPVLLCGLGVRVAYVECRGLDWETPDRHRRTIRRVGLPAWRKRWSNPAEWDLRVGLAAAVVRSATEAVRRQPAPPPVVVRVAPRVG